MRRIDADELDKILKAHVAWLESDGERGARADLSGVDLRRADLEAANLCSAAAMSSSPCSGIRDRFSWTGRLGRTTGTGSSSNEQV